jgi:hypothetical protein
MQAQRARRLRTAMSLPILLTAALCPALAVAPGASAAPGRGAVPAAAPASQGPLTVARAAGQARATGKPVVVTALTTATSQTSAMPDGELRLTESLQPVRVWRGGRWLPLNPDLSKPAGGRIIPQATVSPLSLSGGGTGPLAVLDNYGRTLTLTWPGGALPAPVISGATATYPDVEPGIDLAVTVTAQGGISEVLIIRDAAAAAGQGLAAAMRLDVATPGMTVSAGPDGSVTVTTGPDADPAFAAPAPRVWDSAAPPAGTATAFVNGVTVVSPSGMPAASAISGPGAYAHVSTATQSVSGDTVAVTAPAGSLSGPGVVYPVYVDPSWGGEQYSHDASAWTQIDEGIPGDTSDWMESGAPYLEVGYCDPSEMTNCVNSTTPPGGIGVTRSMFRFPLPTGLPSGTVVNSADIELDDLWQSPVCAAEPLQLWTTPGISSSTDWSNANSWDSELEQESPVGFGSGSSCASSFPDITFGTGSSASAGSAGNLASSLTTAIDKHQTTETFGLRAADESTTDGTAWLQWRFFQDTASDIFLELYYHYPPNAPKLSTSPGGECQGSESAAPVIGNDDISIYGTISDGDGDTGLTTTTSYGFDSSSGGFESFPWIYGPGAGVTDQLLGTIERGDLTSSGYYQITATTTDSFGAQATTNCYFYFDLSAPLAPVVTGLPATVTIGQKLTGLTFSPATGSNCSADPDPCPVTYSYQIGDLAPVSVTANSSGVWTQPSASPITIPVLGTFEFRVSGTNGAGNPSPAWSAEVTSTLPSQPLADGYFSGGKFPDLVTTDPLAEDASLWLAPGTGNGAVGPAVDIGGLGTDVNPGTDGPGDWNNAQIMHGDFTGRNLQDIMAYYTPTAGIGPAASTSTSTGPTPGTGVIIGGTGTDDPLDPYSGNNWTIPSGTFCDLTFNANCPAPADLVYAGNASQEGPATNNGSIYSQTNNADVIGIFGPGGSSSSYELDLFTAYETGGYNLDNLNGVLSGASATSPDGTADWQYYTLATAELPDSAYPNGDPSDTVLFALNDDTGGPYAGNLYVSVNPGCATGTCSTTTLIGMPGTWTKVSGTPSSWASTPPQLASADVNNGANGPGSGTPEIWTVSGSLTATGTGVVSDYTATAYTISGITGTAPAATQEGSGSTLTYPDNSWALNDGAANPGSSPTTATDSITGTADPITDTGYSWANDDSFNDVLDTTNSFVSPPNPIPSGDDTATISLWFRTSSTNAVLVSREDSPITSSMTVNSEVNGGYDPVLYVGADGKLCFEWWMGHPADATCSAKPVDDGLWHHATLAANTSSQTLTLDGTSTTLSGTVDLTSSYFYVGAGHIGGDWPDETYEGEDGDYGSLTFFNGDIADVTFTQ